MAAPCGAYHHQRRGARRPAVGLFRRAERRAAEALQGNARAVNDKIRLLARVGDALIEARNTGSNAFAAIETVLPWDHFAAAVAEAKKLSREDGPDYAALAAANHAVLRRFGPLFLDSFGFEGVTGIGRLQRAIEVIRVFYAGSQRTLPKNMPIGFIRRGWRPAVFLDNGVDVATYELCLFAELRDRLRSGDIWVVGSGQYRAVEDQLIPKALFTTMKIAGPLPVAVSSDASVYLQERRTLLDERLREVDGRAGRSLRPDVRITGATLKISPLLATTPEAAEHLAARISALVPRVRIFNGRAGRRHQPRPHAHCGGLRHRQLSPARLNGWVAPHRRELWSGARPRRRGPAGASLVGIFRRRSHFQLGRSALPTKVISVSEGEAAHVIDGLLYHGGDVDIAVHHTDGGGASDHVFALCHLLGFQFAPRIPNLDDRRLHTFGPATTWRTLEPFIAGKIDKALITTYWDDLLRLALRCDSARCQHP